MSYKTDSCIPTRAESPDLPTNPHSLDLTLFNDLTPIPHNPSLFTAIHSPTNTPVCIKSYPHPLHQLSDKNASSLLCHPHILRLTDCLSQNLFFEPCLYTLESVLASPKTVSESLDILVQILSGLVELHRLRIPWANGHPRNVLLTQRGTWVISDFSFSFHTICRPLSCAFSDDIHAVALIGLQMLRSCSSLVDVIDCCLSDSRPSAQVLLASLTTIHPVLSVNEALGTRVNITIEQIYTRICKIVKTHKRVPGGLEADLVLADGRKAYVRLELAKHKQGVWVKVVRRHGLQRAADAASQAIYKILN